MTDKQTQIFKTPEEVAHDMVKDMISRAVVEIEDEEHYLKLYSKCLKAAQGQRV